MSIQEPRKLRSFYYYIKIFVWLRIFNRGRKIQIIFKQIYSTHRWDPNLYNDSITE